MRQLLVLNPGSTSTKLAVYQDETESVAQSLEHSAADLKPFPNILAQADLRLECVRRFLAESRVDPKTLAAVIGRGGLLKPIASGTYRVNEPMLADLRSGRYGEHASNLGALLADRLAREAGCPAYIVDPVVVDELDDAARLTGLPEIERRSIFHALNQKSVAKETARRLGKRYEECNFIVAHLGGGISIGAHRLGRVVDVNNALDGEGPFSPERAGTLPAGQLAALCFGGKHTLAEVKKKITGNGGLMAHRGTNKLSDISAAAQKGDAKAGQLLAAMALRIGQEIARHGATLCGKIDRIVLTGGMAYDADLMALLRERVEFLAPVEVIPGERELLSLARGALAVLEGREQEQEYR